MFVVQTNENSNNNNKIINKYSKQTRWVKYVRVNWLVASFCYFLLFAHFHLFAAFVCTHNIICLCTMHINTVIIERPYVNVLCAICVSDYPPKYNTGFNIINEWIFMSSSWADHFLCECVCVWVVVLFISPHMMMMLMDSLHTSSLHDLIHCCFPKVIVNWPDYLCLYRESVDNNH